ncbi:MAG TPA: ABC transporter substrate-binding protein [Alphaproteobacteria bacterium]|nr:ABC transporter substrate-binding protein [Alphaproteobacteria bacterium]
MPVIQSRLRVRLRSLVARRRPGAPLALGLAILSLACWSAFALSPAAAAAKGGVVDIAMIGEPQTLDPMASTADLVGTIMQHVYETLYAFDAHGNVAPMLAESMPRISSDGLTYTIPLRQGVEFHNGKEMTADDVIASLKRWMEMAPRGKAVAQEVKSLAAADPHIVTLALNHPYPPLLAQLALPNGFAAIMPATVIANPLTQFIGTGPYMLKERKPDQYVLMVRFDGYKPRSEPASGYAGRREALLDQLRFVPVPNADTRVQGALAGQYQFADLLPAEAYGQLDGKPNVRPVITEHFGFPYLVLNTKQGPLANKTLRQAVQVSLNETDMMTAAFGEPRFFSVEGNFYPKGSLFYSTAGTENYNRADAKKAHALLEAAGYKNTPIRILTSRQYEFHYRMALVMAENLKQAGFKVDMQVVDWATLIQRRNDPALWDIYITHSPFLPEPMLTPPQLGNGAPGWWDTPAKHAALAAFNGESDPVKRGALWGKVQAVIYDEVPFIKVGNFNSLVAVSTRLEGYTPMPWPFFWNVGLKS